MDLFLRASCGCIVLAGYQDGDFRILVEACDPDPNGFPDAVGFTLRNFAGKTFEPISESRSDNLMIRIQKQLAYGRRFLELRGVLGIKAAAEE